MSREEGTEIDRPAVPGTEETSAIERVASGSENHESASGLGRDSLIYSGPFFFLFHRNCTKPLHVERFENADLCKFDHTNAVFARF